MPIPDSIRNYRFLSNPTRLRLLGISNRRFFLQYFTGELIMISFTINNNILKADVEALVCPINLVGTAGRKSLTRSFRKAYPDNYKAYQLAADKDKLRPGQMLVYRTQEAYYQKYIINFPTNRHWSNPSLILDIEMGLDDLIFVIRGNAIKSVAIPALGCAGPYGLDFNRDVKPLIIRAFNRIPRIRVDVYEPKPMNILN